MNKCPRAHERGYDKIEPLKFAAFDARLRNRTSKQLPGKYGSSSAITPSLNELAFALVDCRDDGPDR